MPLQVTIDIIPHGDKSKRRRLATIDIVNDGTGDRYVGRYTVTAEGENIIGQMRATAVRVARIDCLFTVEKCLRALQESEHQCNKEEKP